MAGKRTGGGLVSKWRDLELHFHSGYHHAWHPAGDRWRTLITSHPNKHAFFSSNSDLLHCGRSFVLSYSLGLFVHLQERGPLESRQFHQHLKEEQKSELAACQTAGRRKASTHSGLVLAGVSRAERLLLLQLHSPPPFLCSAALTRPLQHLGSRLVFFFFAVLIWSIFG